MLKNYEGEYAAVYDGVSNLRKSYELLNLNTDN